jgi:hypothetical protein
MAILKSKSRVTSAGKAEQSFIPMVNTGDFFGVV